MSEAPSHVLKILEAVTQRPQRDGLVRGRAEERLRLDLRPSRSSHANDTGGRLSYSVGLRVPFDVARTSLRAVLVALLLPS
jgi:hypothetical protein